MKYFKHSLRPYMSVLNRGTNLCVFSSQLLEISPRDEIKSALGLTNTTQFCHSASTSKDNTNFAVKQHGMHTFYFCYASNTKYLTSLEVSYRCLLTKYCYKLLINRKKVY